MRVTVTGVHVETGEALREQAVRKVEEFLQYFEKVNDVHVAFVQEAHHHHLHACEVTAQANGIVLRGEGQGIDFYAALDDAAGKITRQLERYKGRLNKHRERRKKFKEHMKDMGPIAFEEAHVVEDLLEDVPQETFRDFAPEIVKKEVSRVAPMSVDEAVMQMDLLHKPAFLFMNVASGQLNMVYREGGNTIRWIAPK
jgi:putative sigma-54 modulation protein